MDFADNTVQIDATWSASQLSVEVQDDAGRFSQEVIDHLSEPFVTTRRGYVDRNEPNEASHEGMALGICIARTLLERSGARVNTTNRIRKTGALVRLVWPRKDMDVARQVEISNHECVKPAIALTPYGNITTTVTAG